MTVETAPVQSGLAVAEGAGRAAAYPIVFSETLGHFLPEDPGVSRKDVAVLLLSPWGYDEMCVRKTYRILAERLAAKGMASLRFDYPGTGDASEKADLSEGLPAWEKAALEAAALLRDLAHVDRLILVGQGIGATLAHRIEGRLENVAGVALLAPVVSGRTYLREVGFRAKFIYEDLGLKDAARDFEGVTIAGLKMPESVAAQVGKIKLTGEVHGSSAPHLIIERAVKMDDTSLLDALRAQGVDAEQSAYIGYDDLMTMPLTAREPVEVMERIVNWASSLALPLHAAPSDLPDPDQRLHGEGYAECPVRFGAYQHLAGIVTLPDTLDAAGRSVLLLTTAYDRHSGWGGTSAWIARNLARQGIASLRYDSAAVGDSPPRPQAPVRVLYHDSQDEDVTAALDCLEHYRHGPVMVAGRCSGGYLAFRSGLSDDRVKAIVSVNPFVFYWDPEKVIPEDISVVPRSLDDYGQRFMRLETLKRLIAGEVNVKAAARNMLVALGRRLSFRIAPLLNLLMPDRHKVTREVRRSFDHYRDAHVPVTILYSEGDVGLEHLYFQFGSDGHKLRRYPNVALEFLPDADHNLTPRHHRQRLFDAIADLARPKSPT